MTDAKMRPSGGSAFPIPNEESPAGGMTLRDYFAGQALVSLVGLWHNGADLCADKAAENAYKYADAMIEERTRP